MTKEIIPRGELQKERFPTYISGSFVISCSSSAHTPPDWSKNGFINPLKVNSVDDAVTVLRGAINKMVQMHETNGKGQCDKDPLMNISADIGQTHIDINYHYDPADFGQDIDGFARS